MHCDNVISRLIFILLPCLSPRLSVCKSKGDIFFIHPFDIVNETGS